MKKIIDTDRAPKAIGPYSQAVAVDDYIFTAGQIAIIPQTNTLVQGNVTAQTRQVLENLKAVIEAAGATVASVVKTTVYLTKPEDFAVMNDVYAEYFNNEPPARSTVFVTALPKGALVEIDIIAKILRH